MSPTFAHTSSRRLPQNEADSVEVLKREHAQLLTYGFYGFWMPWTHNMFASRGMLASISRQQKISELALCFDRTIETDIAVVTDQESQIVSSWSQTPVRMVMNVLNRIGTSYDYYELGDFLRDDIYPKYKVVLFLNIAYLTEKERRGISKLKSDGRMLIWTFGAGVFNPDRKRAGIFNTERLIEIKLKENRTKPKDRTVYLLKENFEKFFGRRIAASILIDIQKNVMKHTYGVMPFEVRDPEAAVLGTLGKAYPCFAAKKFPEWTSVYCAADYLGPEVIRYLIKAAGGHVYLDTNDIVFTNKHFIAVHSATAGKKKIKLRGAGDVFDLYREKFIGRAIESFEISMPPKKTEYFFIGDGSQFQEIFDKVSAEKKADSGRISKQIDTLTNQLKDKEYITLD